MKTILNHELKLVAIEKIKSMKRKSLFLLFFIILSITFSFAQSELTPYVEFLQKQQTPKEYIFTLWKESDIIILGERDHRDTTQYNLILDILSDKRFIENIGYLYLEVGVVNATEDANALIKENFVNQSDFNKRFTELQMKEVWHPQPWLNYNRYQLLSGLAKINRNLPKEKQITIGLIDMEFCWDDMTPEKYKKFITTDMSKEFTTREKIMADNFLALYSVQPRRNDTKKALIITSREYAGKQTFSYLNKKTKRQAGYIKDVLEEKVKTVALNWYKWLPLNWHRSVLPDKTNGLSANGKWDAVFELTNNTPTGFDLESSPFGNDEYDYAYHKGLKWKDVFDGFIFYIPYYSHTAKMGFPFELSSEQAKEVIRRTMIYEKAHGNTKNIRLLKWLGWIEKNRVKKDYNRQRELQCIDFYPNSEKWIDEMNKWIESN